MSHTLALSSDWQDVEPVTTITTNSTTFNGLNQATWYYPYPWGYPVVSSPTRPIKLTLSEIEKLRKAAKADKSVREILAKFTDLIEITVDFQ